MAMKFVVVCLVFVVYTVAAAAVCSDCDGPVNIVTYYESMCPFSRKFLTTQLYPTFQKLPDSVMNVTIIPYGFAHEKKQNDTWVMYNCQHGPKECEGNVIAACALNMTNNNPRAYMPFINCMELETRHLLVTQLMALNKCAPQAKLSHDDLLSCYRSKEGADLHHNMQLLTKAGHIHYVPWIVVDGEHDNVIQHDAYYHLLEVVCQRYNGTEPDACKQRHKATLIG